jgi:type III secretion protein U
MGTEQKTEPPTERRLRQARREGDHPLSRVAVSFGALAGATLVLPFVVRSLFAQLNEMLTLSLRAETEPLLGGLATRVVRLVSPVLGVAALVALAVGLGQTRGGLSLSPLGWASGRPSPLGRRSAGLGFPVLDLLRIAIASLLFGWFGWRLLESLGEDLAASLGSGPGALTLGSKAGEQLLYGALLVLFAGAVADSILVWFAWYARLRMTREEVRRERRESEGDPTLKQARERTHRELLESAPLGRIAEAALVVLGKSHLGTALAYDPAHDAAPVVLLQARGASLASLKALAAAHALPVVDDPELGQLLADLPAGEPIPSTLYSAVSSAMLAARRERRSPSS